MVKYHHVSTLGVKYLTTVSLEKKYENRISELETEIKSASRTYYTVSNEIKRGDVLSKDNTVKIAGYLTAPGDLLMTEKDMGKATVIGIKPGEVITTGMLAETGLDNGLRELEYNIFHLAANLVSGDTVDIRIYFPNGENYIVLSKKELKNIDHYTSDCFLWLNEQEILMVSSAVVDAYMNPGTTLSTAKYVEPNIQDGSITTYVPSENVIDLIERDPNILIVAKEAINREIRARMESTRMKNEDNSGDFMDTPQEDKNSFLNYLYPGQEDGTVPEQGQTGDVDAGAGAGQAGQTGGIPGYWEGVGE